MLVLNLSNPKSSSLSPPLPLPSFFPTRLPKTLPFPNPNNNRSSLLVRASSDTRALSQSAIKRIADKLRSLGYGEDDNDNPNPKPSSTPNSTSTSPGEIFVPLPNQLQNHRVGHTLDPSWSTPENPIPRPGSGLAIKRYHELKREFWKEKQEEMAKVKAEGREKLAPTLAELKLSAEELRRLRGVGIALRKKLKIGKAGITEGIVNGIHERWRRTEVVKITCEDMARMNMKRTHDLLERKTGGLVVWRSGSNIVLYRGVDYKYPYFIEGDVEPNDTSDDASVDLQVDLGVDGGSYSSNMDGATSVRHRVANNATQPPLIRGVGLANRVRFQLPGEAQLVEQADLLLDGLGPRFTDWYGYDPQPVDADLLPATVPGYRRPFRLLPYGVNSKLTNDEMTTLKRLGRPLPCHFALGRNRKLQGLAAAILKLWEKCEIAKIAVKRGVQNTNSSLMVDELKNLTGGIVLSRDKEYIVLYRGKDFLPAAVSSAIEQRRKFGTHAEERRIISSSSDAQQEGKNGRTESTSETGDAQMTDQKPIDQKKLRSREVSFTRTSTKLSLALEKKERAEKLLEKLEMEEIKQEPVVDKEGITKEERYMLRKVGLKMKPFLLLGRRGVFDGTVENMHLHWKYRELVKILSGEKSIEEVHAVARTLEAESGGILVAVERVSKGHAIIVYRGKNYERPASLRPRTLLSKREALKRSIELQRRESLKLHVLKLSRNVDELKLKLEKDKEATDVQSADDSELLFNVEKSQSSESKGSETNLDISSATSSNQKTVKQLKGSDTHGADSMSVNPNGGMETPGDNLEPTQQDILSEFSMEFEVMDGDELGAAEALSDVSGDRAPTNQRISVSNFSGKYREEPHSMADSLKEADAVLEMNSRIGEVESVNSTSASFRISDDHKTSNSNIHSGVSHLPDPKNQVPYVEPIYVPKESKSTSFRAARLSNKERLILRKQALKWKKRPVLAVGKSNIVTGVAKNIKKHFEKHPLAIVNVKGRAKGTSVQEVVAKLEEATGAVLVSQEPSKVILYRGWGAHEQRDQANKTKTRNHENATDKPIISPELIAAIRLECGLQSNLEGRSVE